MLTEYQELDKTTRGLVNIADYTVEIGRAREFHGTNSLWLDSKLSLWLSPPVMEPWE
jgi:hypothetical protein